MIMACGRILDIMDATIPSMIRAMIIFDTMESWVNDMLFERRSDR